MARSFLHRRAENPALMACYGRYSSDLAISQYCDAHYGPDKFGVANFPMQLAKLCVTAMAEKKLDRALDLGCAVGRASFELATYFGQVTGIDYSSHFIDIAQRIKERGRISYKISKEGELILDNKVTLADLGLGQTAHKVTFQQGDAQCFETHFSDYDLVLAANLIDRLPDPGKFLGRIHQRLVIGGLLVIASPYNWLEHFTPHKKWLGGRFHAGIPLVSLDGLRMKLTKHFNEVGDPQELEFVIGETARTFHHSISQVTLWCRFR